MRRKDSEPKSSMTVGATTTTSDEQLVARTLRTVAVLVAACVVFVGLLSITAVVVTSRAVGGSDTASASAKAPEPGPTAAKKPLSI